MCVSISFPSIPVDPSKTYSSTPVLVVIMPLLYPGLGFQRLPWNLHTSFTCKSLKKTLNGLKRWTKYLFQIKNVCLSTILDPSSPVVSAQRHSVGGSPSAASGKQRVRSLLSEAVTGEEAVTQVECRPGLWDTACDEYHNKYKRHDWWTQICRELFPLLDEADKKLQFQIDKDVRNRWRSVKDRFQKDQAKANLSGSAAPSKKILFEDELQFLNTGRRLRPTEGNMMPEAPNVTLEPESDCDMLPLATDDLEDIGSPAAANLSLELPSTAPEPSASEERLDTDCSATTSNRCPSMPSSSVANKDRSTILLRKKGKSTKSSTVSEKCDQLTCEALSLLKKSSSQANKCDSFAASLSSRLQEMNKPTQSTCMAACCALFDGFEAPPPSHSSKNCKCNL
ncbi:uncharacterized protein LOC142251872 [Anomaloglossus baeobatrachus]|uniref:uncharacterized protein LOC142251872 n=1 Tax=Anomaloglossus baeobatrachus TaxID=238106 RepID=UPI003F4F6429